ncbi:MAG TPA: hypothetical protein VHO69_10765 [Phototrophicaceae bacterium]|nr:hypothetical protein [Phototrophicaceae bacterium]
MSDQPIRNLPRAGQPSIKKLGQTSSFSPPPRCAFLDATVIE